MDQPDPIPETRKVVTYRDAAEGIFGGAIVAAGAGAVIAATGLRGFVLGVLVGGLMFLSGTWKAIRITYRAATGRAPLTEAVPARPAAPSNQVRFEGRVGYDSPGRRAASLPLLNLDGVTTSDEGFTWEVTVSGATNPNLHGSWPWAEIEVCGVTTAGKSQVHVRRGAETVVYQGKQVEDLAATLQKHLGNRFVR